MTTSVIYDSAVRGLNMAQRPSASTTTAGASLSAIYSNLSTLFTTGVTQVQSINNSASTTNPTATFTNTPTNGNAMIAIIIRGSDNVASTNANWTLITSAGTAGTRRLELWWRRAGASEAKAHTWTNATANLWECTLLEFGGWATKADPIAILSAQNVATNTSYTYPSVGVLCGVQALVTSGGSAGTFTDTGTNAETVTNIGVTTTTRFRTFIVDAYTNRETQTIQNSWTTSRPFTVGSIGWPNGNSTGQGSLGLGVGNDSTANGTNALYAAQLGFSYDTSSIPSANTVTSVTATYAAAGGASGFPSTATVDVYSLSGASIAASNTNGPAVWKTPTELSSLTRVASRAAGSTWVGGNTYNWTSDAAFTSAIVKAGTTTLLIATSDQVSGTTRASDQYALFAESAGQSYLTIVHNLQLSRTVAATSSLTPAISRVVTTARSVVSTLGLTPAITRIASYARSIAASTTQIPVIARLVSYARTITGTTTLTPAINRVTNFARTISNTIDATPTIVATRAFLRTIASSTTVTPAITAARTVVRIIAATVTTTASIVATVIPIVVGIPHKISLRVRSTVTLPGLERIRLTVRSRLRLPE